MPSSKGIKKRSRRLDTAGVAGRRSRAGSSASNRRSSGRDEAHTGIEQHHNADPTKVPRTVPQEPSELLELLDELPVQPQSYSYQAESQNINSYAAQENEHRDAVLPDPTRDSLPPRYDAESWDVKVVCGPYRWYLHKKVLRKCRYFSSLLPVHNEDNRNWSAIHLVNHNASQLAQVLRFMYYRDYPGADYDHENPLYGDSLLTNTAMYMAGASLGHNGMMSFATRRIESWVSAILPSAPINSTENWKGKMKQQGPNEPAVCSESPLYKAVCDPDGLMDYAVLRLVYPLYRSLTIVYEQPPVLHAGQLKDLRVALIRFVASALPLLAINPAFQAHFRNEWLRQLQSPSYSGKLADFSIADWISADYAFLFDHRLVGWQQGPGVGNAFRATHFPGFSVDRIMALLRKLSQNELSKICTINRKVNSSDGVRVVSWTFESETDRQEWKTRLERSKEDHEHTLKELQFWFDKILPR